MYTSQGDADSSIQDSVPPGIRDQGMKEAEDMIEAIENEIKEELALDDSDEGSSGRPRASSSGKSPTGAHASSPLPAPLPRHVASNPCNAAFPRTPLSPAQQIKADREGQGNGTPMDSFIDDDGDTNADALDLKAQIKKVRAIYVVEATCVYRLLMLASG